jgi:hypothetical protein
VIVRHANGINKWHQAGLFEMSGRVTSSRAATALPFSTKTAH